MERVRSSRTHHRIGGATVFLLMVALVAGMVGCEAPGELPVIASFTASPDTINVGNSSTLSWSVSGATQVTIEPGIGPVAATGTYTVSPTTTTTYTITASNSAGSRTATVEVTVVALPVINSFTASPEVIVLGGNSTLSWSVSGATEVTIEPGIGPVAATGTRTVSPTRTATYTLKASNSAGSSTATVHIQMPVVYDFVDKASHSSTWWWNGAVELTFPGAGNDNRGFARYVTNAVLEDNVTYPKVLETHPRWIDDGYIVGVYYELRDLGFKVQTGDRFYAKVGFLKNAGAGNVKFRVAIVAEMSEPTYIAEITDAYDGTVRTIDIDLSPYAGGPTYVFALEVDANGSSGQDWAVWVEAKIIHPYVL